MKNLFIPTIAICALLLAGCSGEPSKSDMQAAVDKTMGALGGTKSSIMEIVEKLACKEGETSVQQVCTVQAKVPMLDGSRTVPLTLRMVKGSEGWQVEAFR